jgi:Secretion system C-terminal sorting domain
MLKILPFMFMRFFIFLLLVSVHTQLSAQTCTSTAAGAWNASNFSCTGGFTLANCSEIIINHPISITGTTVILGPQAVAITINSSLTISKSGSVDGILDLTNGSSTVFIASGGSIVAGAGGNNNEIQIGTNTYGGADFASITAQAPVTMSESGLPIQLSRFTAKTKEAAVLLEWQTKTELNNDYMAVEHSTDGTKWQEIGSVQGAGNSTRTKDYAFEDASPALGYNYYRLRQVDFDGKEAFSPVLELRFKNNAQVQVWPNPARDLLYWSQESGNETTSYWELLSADGRIVRSGAAEDSVEAASIDVRELPEGNYIFRLVSEGQAPFVQKVAVGK